MLLGEDAHYGGCQADFDDGADNEGAAEGGVVDLWMSRFSESK